MFIIYSFANIKQLFPSQCLETSNCEVAEESTEAVVHSGYYVVPQRIKKGFTVSELLELLRKLCFS